MGPAIVPLLLLLLLLLHVMPVYYIGHLTVAAPVLRCMLLLLLPRLLLPLLLTQLGRVHMVPLWVPRIQIIRGEIHNKRRGRRGACSISALHARSTDCSASKRTNSALSTLGIACIACKRPQCSHAAASNA